VDGNHKDFNKYGRETVIEVDLDAIHHNIQQFRKHLPNHTMIMVAVKANAYGHGAVPVSKAALEAGADALAVAFIDEGIELRTAGLIAPILVLGYTPIDAIPDALQADLMLTVYDLESLKAIDQVARERGIRAKIHVKVDTGMGRIGLLPESVPNFLQNVMKMEHVELQGMFTHLATADEKDKIYMNEQLARWEKVLAEVKALGIKIPIVHCNNSAGVIENPASSYQMVRIGISLYGCYPSREVNHQVVRLKPVLSLKSKVIHLKKPPAKMGISYGRTFVVNGNEWIATVPVGYADGFSRALSNRGHALVNGVKVPIVGRVCMDQLMLDVTEAMPVQVGDEVVLYGKQGDQQISVDEIAEQLQTINYEVLTSLSHRIPRIYLRNGKIIQVVNRLRDQEYHVTRSANR
jgi:alanine racemase